MRADPCLACYSRARLQMEATVSCGTALVEFCHGCGYPTETLAMLDPDGHEIEWSKDEECEAMDQAALMLEEHGDRPVALRRLRDYACLRWSTTSNLRYLTLARKLESARRRAVQPLRLTTDIDRVELGPSHVELLAITRAELRWRGEGLARKAVIARAGAVSLHVQSRSALSAHVDEAIREAATQDGVFATYRPGTTETPSDRGASGATGGGDREGLAAPGEAEGEGAA